jgi:hypothetical protein
MSETKVAQGELFGGKTFDEFLDGARLKSQLGKIRGWLESHQMGWFTIDEITFRANLRGTTPQSVSARIRDLRKAAFGAYLIEQRRRPTPNDKRGVWEYSMRGGRGAGTPRRVICPHCHAPISLG